MNAKRASITFGATFGSFYAPSASQASLNLSKFCELIMASDGALTPRNQNTARKIEVKARKVIDQK